MVYEGRGRGQGRGFGRGGRGRGRSGGRRNFQGNNGSGKDKATEIKFATQGPRTNTASYNTVKEAVINYVQKNYKNGQDVAKSLKQMEKVEPEFETLDEKSDETKRALEQAGFNIKYQEEL